MGLFLFLLLCLALGSMVATFDTLAAREKQEREARLEKFKQTTQKLRESNAKIRECTRKIQESNKRLKKSNQELAESLGGMREATADTRKSIEQFNDQL